MRLFAIAKLGAISLIALLYSAPVKVDAQSASQMNLAFVLPVARPHEIGQTSLSNSRKIGNDATVIGAGALIASDDSGLYRTIVGEHGPSKSVHEVANVVTHLGDPEVVFPLVGLVYLSGGDRNRDLAWRASVAMLKAGAIGLVAKEVIGRGRPDGYQGGSASRFHPFSGKDAFDSFPSGHTLIAFSAATVWADEKPKERYIAYSLATLVGTSRILKADHWPSDVFFGALLGISQATSVKRGYTNLFDFRF